MQNQHLTYFKVENFKKFDSLEVKDIGQFNLIVGDNNVGKTCFLEALFFTEYDYSQLSQHLVNSLKRRNILTENINLKKSELIHLVKKNLIKNKKDEYISYSFFPEYDYDNEKYYEDISHTIIVDNIYYDENADKISDEAEVIRFDILFNIEKNLKYNFPFIAFNSTYEIDIFQLYNNIKTKSDKENLIKTLKVINDSIIDVELRQNFDELENVFLLSFKNKDEFVPVNYLGDGFKRIFYIILKVLSLKGKKIMIDEIETGIHYSRQKGFWINILKICNELDVQIFATTHSNECLQAFYEASKELNEQKDIRLISLQEGEQEKIYSTTYNFENIEAGLYSNIELRA
ncbi:AAA family ATPase [uncultured Chryseobacterium sp.]|uniref:AAA family ATPase n=1 Tax=uncultured Chryseobacterium sp. TaxID=259322 RepID=UPI0025FCCBAE|nr:AAA family ATPase [uncultured Chryseobacterium sp.]